MKELRKINIIRAMVMIMLCIVFIVTLIPVAKTAETLIKLFIISDNITFYEETAAVSPSGWSESLIEKYEKQIQLRNDLLNSSNKLVSLLASSGNLIRFFLLCLTIVPPCGIAWFLSTLFKVELHEVKKYYRMKKKTKK